MIKGFSKGVILSLTASSLWAGSMGDAVEQQWAGLYVGGNIGGIWSQFNGPVTAAAFPAGPIVNPASIHQFHANSSSFMGGGQLGYNWQLNNIVFGTEISAEGMNLKRAHTLNANEVVSNLDVFSPGDSFSSTITGKRNG